MAWVSQISAGAPAATAARPTPGASFVFPTPPALPRAGALRPGEAAVGGETHSRDGVAGSSPTCLVAGAVAVGALSLGRRQARASRRSVARQAVGLSINGFGRLGRAVARIAINDPDVDLKLINSSNDTRYMAYLMKYDSAHGRYPGTIEVDGDDALIIDGHRVAVSHTRDASEIPFGETGGEYVVEVTGQYRTEEKVEAHVKAGAKKVVLPAPSADNLNPLCLGVNESDYDPSMTLVSSPLTGYIPVVKVLEDRWGIERGFLTVVHATTATQVIVDSKSKRKSWRGGRSAPGNICHDPTFAAKAVGQVIPSLKGKLLGTQFRVPAMNVCACDLTVELKKPTTYEEICAEMKRRSEGDMKGILGYTDEPLVSSDFMSSALSCTFDAKGGIMLDPTFVKIICWHDNEVAYAARCVDLCKYMEKVDAEAEKK